MDIKILKNFITIAESGSICKAAKELHISQPPLSKQIHSLEEELGVKLFERSNRGIQLTKEGNLLYRHANSLIAYSNQIKRELMHEEDAIIRLGMITSSVQYTLALIRKFFKDEPTHFEITEGNSFHLLNLLENDMIDLAFIRTPFDMTKSFDYIKLTNDKLVATGLHSFFPEKTDRELAVHGAGKPGTSGTQSPSENFIDQEYARPEQNSADQEMTSRRNEPQDSPEQAHTEQEDTVTLEEIVSLPLITIRRWKDLLDMNFAPLKKTVNYRFICDDNRTSLTMAMNGMGVAILPDSMVDKNYSKGALAKKIIEGGGFRTSIYAVYKPSRDFNKCTNQFLDDIISMDIDGTDHPQRMAKLMTTI